MAHAVLDGVEGQLPAENVARGNLDQREGTAADIAEAVWFLASPAAPHITARVLHVNGGALATR
ncbi:hypothetical protein GCM10009744_46080 [Kribbella alba]|uniref:SDR family oxidoreductase n=1 Tax=Kribbella alba TaxID=190197 RepID=A0ABN2FK18_9ACTN